MGHGDTARAVAIAPFGSTVCIQLQFPAAAVAGFGGQVKTILQGPSLGMVAASLTQNGPTWLTYYITPSSTLIDFSTAPGWVLDLRDSTAKPHLDGYDVFPRITFGPATAACPNPRPMLLE